MAGSSDATTAELEPGQCAVILGEDDGEITVRVVATPDVVAEGSDAAEVLEFARALAKRIRKDPDFKEDVLDWYYDHEDDAEKDEDSDDDD